MPDEGYTAAAVPVPDTGDDTLRKRVREYIREQKEDSRSVPASSEEAWELSTRREVARELENVLEVTDG